MQEQEIRERVVKCMTEYADRRDACVKRFLDLRPGWSFEGVRDLFEKCHKAVLANVAIEKAIVGTL